MFRGGIWPVLQRELRAGARRPFLYWLRTGAGLGAVASLVPLMLQAERENISVPDLGTALFGALHSLLLILMGAVVPALTADCLARERRDGTLGLLFLTDLTAPAIVVGKALAQVLRAATVWLAAIPLLTISLLAGGITPSGIIDHLLIELAVGFSALAAGLLASSLVQNRAAAFFLAFAFAAIFITAIVGVCGGLDFDLDGGVVTLPLSAGRERLEVGFFLAAIGLFASLLIAGICVEQSWQDRVPSARRQRLIQEYSAPLWQSWSIRRRQRQLDHNPISWLQGYSWMSRVTNLSFCLGFVVIESMIASINPSPEAVIQLLVLFSLILAISYTYAGVNGFFVEKRSGALELILVTPLSVKQIIFGRVLGLWQQFALPLLAVAPMFIINWPNDWGSRWRTGTLSLLVYLALPVIATCCALVVNNLILATAFTWATLLTAILFGTAMDGPGMVTLMAVLVFAGYRLTAQNLALRRYAIDG